MTNNKRVRKSVLRKALFSSVISLVLCCTMLIGTTFAWFTDSATSANNLIKSGNLDIVVEYTLDGENWKNLDGASDLFQKGLWEPGHTEVVALKIQNKGTLALKYSANMNIAEEIAGVNMAGEEFKLSEYLTVSTLTQGANDVGDICLYLAYLGENSVAYETTTKFTDTNVLKEIGRAHV